MPGQESVRKILTLVKNTDGDYQPESANLVLVMGSGSVAFDFMSYSTGLAKEKVEEWSGVADKANASGFSTQFFQRITKAAKDARDPIDDLTEALRRSNTASTDTLSYTSDLLLKLAATRAEMHHTDNNTLHRVKRYHPSAEMPEIKKGGTPRWLPG